MKFKINKQCGRCKVTLISLFISFFFSTFASATSAVLVNDSKLKANDSFKAKDLSLLVKGEVVEIKQRKRGWYQVQTKNKKSGWLTLLQLRFESELKGKGSSELTKLVSLRKGHSNVTATTGVRGIGENDIKNATPNFVALEQTKQFTASEVEAKKFAKEVLLKTQQIKYQEKTK